LQDFQIILEESAYSEEKVKIRTKERGIIIGIYLAPDEFESDPDRYGFQIETGENKLDTVFLDEIIEIESYNTETVMVLSQSNLGYASGK